MALRLTDAAGDEFCGGYWPQMVEAKKLTFTTGRDFIAPIIGAVNYVVFGMEVDGYPTDYCIGIVAVRDDGARYAAIVAYDESSRFDCYLEVYAANLPGVALDTILRAEFGGNSSIYYTGFCEPRGRHAALMAEA